MYDLHRVGMSMHISVIGVSRGALYEIGRKLIQSKVQTSFCSRDPPLPPGTFLDLCEAEKQSSSHKETVLRTFPLSCNIKYTFPGKLYVYCWIG